MHFLDWVQEAPQMLVSSELRSFVRDKFSSTHGAKCQIQSREFGGAGDCLFHSIAGALARMLLEGDASAAHVFSKIPVELWQQGRESVMRRLRMLSAERLSSWGYEELLDDIRHGCPMGAFIVRAG